jgi:hypothetical protein
MDTHTRWPRLPYKESLRSGFYSFISYTAREEEMQILKPFIDRYVDELKKHIAYIPIYYDRVYLPDGHCRLDEKLAEAIAVSDFTTAFLSPGYTSSPWCTFEWGCATTRSQIAGERIHSVLPIVWKLPVELSSRWRTIYITDQFKKKDYESALHRAVEGTLKFLDWRYG